MKCLQNLIISSFAEMSKILMLFLHHRVGILSTYRTKSSQSIEVDRVARFAPTNK
jgi:hypothetical protein